MASVDGSGAPPRRDARRADHRARGHGSPCRCRRQCARGRARRRSGIPGNVDLHQRDLQRLRPRRRVVLVGVGRHPGARVRVLHREQQLHLHTGVDVLGHRDHHLHHPGFRQHERDRHGVRAGRRRSVGVRAADAGGRLFRDGRRRSTVVHGRGDRRQRHRPAGADLDARRDRRLDVEGHGHGQWSVHVLAAGGVHGSGQVRVSGR